MLEKTIVLDRKDGVLHRLRYLIVGDRDSALERKLTDDGLAVVSNHSGHQIWAVVCETGNLLRLLGHTRLIGYRRAKHHARHHRESYERQKGVAAEEFLKPVWRQTNSRSSRFKSIKYG